MPHPTRFRLSLYAAALAKPFAPLIMMLRLNRLAAMLTLAPWFPPRGSIYPVAGIVPAQGTRKARVALMSGCVDQVASPRVRDAAARLLARHGVEVVFARGEGCCGSLSHHLGREKEAVAFVKNNVDAWTREIEGQGLDAIVITASGCGTTIKDYGYMLRLDADYAEKAARVSALARDISEYVASLELMPLATASRIRLAYHSACSMQHGQKVTREPKMVLARAGFDVRDVPEGHLCCGSAGTYNMLQPEIAERLRDRKVKNIESTRPQAIATGNIGCLTQIGSGTSIPVVHTVELLDWATGGPTPAAIRGTALA
jgi:glycolate oxidase iron-sulfur subunit